jgi:hypothetical protein
MITYRSIPHDGVQAESDSADVTRRHDISRIPETRGNNMVRVLGISELQELVLSSPTVVNDDNSGKADYNQG